MRIIPITGRWSWALGALAVVTIGLGGCGGGDAGAGDDGKLSVVAGFYPLAEAAERVGGDRVAVQNLTPAGSEPHDLELAPDQVEDLEDADLVITLGRGFQPAVEQVAGRRGGATLELLDVLPVPGGEVADGHAEEEDAHGDDQEGHADEGNAHGDDEHGEDAEGHAEEEEGHADEHGEDEHAHEAGALDPHVWLDPTMHAAAVEAIADALTELDPDGAEVFAAGAAAFTTELEELDAEFQEALTGCKRSTIVVSHEAFGWLTARYGLDQEGIAGLSPEAEPDPGRLAELTDLVQAEGITTVFTEALVSPRVSETLAREAGVETAVLNPLEGLTDEQVAAGATYTSVMRENLVTLTEALGCT